MYFYAYNKEADTLFRTTSYDLRDAFVVSHPAPVRDGWAWLSPPEAEAVLNRQIETAAPAERAWWEPWMGEDGVTGDFLTVSADLTPSVLAEIVKDVPVRRRTRK